MRYPEYRALVRADLHRYDGRTDLPCFFRHVFLNPGFKYTFWMRTARYLKSWGPAGAPLYALSRVLLNRYKLRYGISIPYNTDIGAGLYIGHFGGIVVNHQAKIGRNCNINHGVTIGVTYGGKSPGVPAIGNNVYLGPGSKVIGGIAIGDGAAVGANSVVTKSVPDRAVVVGIPGEIVSQKGSSSYVVNTVG